MNTTKTNSSRNSYRNSSSLSEINLTWMRSIPAKPLLIMLLVSQNRQDNRIQRILWCIFFLDSIVIPFSKRRLWCSHCWFFNSSSWWLWYVTHCACTNFLGKARFFVTLFFIRTLWCSPCWFLSVHVWRPWYVIHLIFLFIDICIL